MTTPRRPRRQRKARPSAVPPLEVLLADPEVPEEPAEIPAAVLAPGPEPARIGESRRLKKLAAEKWLRENESLRLYEPLREADKFHASRRPTRLLRGSNRAGKTLTAAAEFARTVTGQDPFKKLKAADGLAVCVGLDEEQCGAVLYRKLCKPNAFRIIKDLVTGRWRVYRPWTDLERAAETRPAPPLIPKRFILDTSWQEKKREIPRMLKLTTGWTIYFFSSKAAPPQGWQIDIWWIDEECTSEAWLPELQARVVDNHGTGMWDATPQVANPQLYELHCRYEDGDDLVDEHVLLLSENPYIDEQAKEIFSRNLTEEERRVRIDGEFRLTGFRVYPEFSMQYHGYDAPSALPDDWARWLFVDPGRQVCAVLFVAVPPPGQRQNVYFYDELYLKGCDAEKFASAVKSKSDGVSYEAFYIDRHGAANHDTGSGKTVEAQYREALKRHGVASRLTGHGFALADDDPDAGILAFRELLRVRSDDTPRLQVARGRLPSLEWEMKHYHYQRDRNGLVSDKPVKKNDHLVDDCRYAATAPLRWHKPARPKKAKSEAVRSMEKKKKNKRERQRQRPTSVSMG